jgi:hypothetical protein
MDRILRERGGSDNYDKYRQSGTPRAATQRGSWGEHVSYTFEQKSPVRKRWGLFLIGIDTQGV